MERNKLFDYISENIMDTQQVMDYLGISRRRLYDLIDNDILIPLRKGIYLKADVEKRREVQGDLREKYYKPSKKGNDENE